MIRRRTYVRKAAQGHERRGKDDDAPGEGGGLESVVSCRKQPDDA